MAAEEYRGAERVFCWSFAGQGIIQAHGGELLQCAPIFWRPNPTTVRRRKGRFLAERMRRADSIDSRQSGAIQSQRDGRLTDKDAQELLGALATQNQGLCVVTSRQKIVELENQFERQHCQAD